jgi:hypothetical protein
VSVAASPTGDRDLALAGAALFSAALAGASLLTLTSRLSRARR